MPAEVPGRLGAVVCLAVLGGGLFGLDIGLVGSVIQMGDFEERFVRRSVWEFGLIAAGMNIGALLFCGLAGPAAERWGRRDTIGVAAGLFSLLAIWQGASDGFAGMFTGRVLSGGCIAACATVVPVYVSELAPADRRGGLVSLQQTAIGGSIMLVYWLAWALKPLRTTGLLTNWRLCFYLSALPSLVLCIGLQWCPRSPRWLIGSGREPEARAALLTLRGSARHEQVAAELEWIKSELRSEKAEPEADCAALFGTVPMRRIAAAGFLVQLFQQVQGINCIMYFGPMVVAGFGYDGNLFTGLVQTCNFGFTFLSVVFVDTVGRRRLLLIGSGLMLLTMLTIGLVGLNNGHRDDHGDWELDSRGWGGLCIMCFVVYLAGFAATWGPVGWLIPSEIFPLRHRTRGMVLAAYANWGSNALLGLFFPAAMRQFGFSTYFLFSLMCVLAILFVLGLPETKGVPLESMEALFGAGIQPEIEPAPSAQEAVGVFLERPKDNSGDPDVQFEHEPVQETDETEHAELL